METILATYRVRARGAEAERRAETLLLEQTVELPREAVRDGFVLDEILPEVHAIADADEQHSLVTLAFPAVTSAFEIGQLVNVLFGNSSLQPDLALVDLALPLDLRVALGGPRFGIEGLRLICGRPAGPLTCTALKPMGLTPDALAALCATLARAGLDVIKDDHGLADHSFCPADARIRACTEAVARVADETGRSAVYAPNLLGGPRALAMQWGRARACGARAVLIAPMLVGLPVFHDLVHGEIDVPVLAHPALGGAAAIAPEVLLGRLFRAAGADAVIYPHHGGRFAYSPRTCGDLARLLREPWEPLASSMPTPAGGMSVERVPELVRFYGDDVMLLVGGSLFLAGDRLEERAEEFVRAAREAHGEARP